MRDCRTLGVCHDRPVRCGDCPLPSLRVIQATSHEWGIQLPVRPLLRAPGAIRAPKQKAGVRDVGRDSPISGRAWPGRGAGVRGPGIDETPLSACEVEHGQMKGLL